MLGIREKKRPKIKKKSADTKNRVREHGSRNNGLKKNSVQKRVPVFSVERLSVGGVRNAAIYCNFAINCGIYNTN